MATTADTLRAVADRHVKRLTTAVEAGLRRGAGRIDESALAAALAAGSRSRAIQIAERAIEDGDLRTLVREPIEERLLDVAEDAADATRCAVRPTTSPAEQLARSRPAANAAAQVAAEASEVAARRLIGNDTVRVTADMKRALDATPLRRPSDLSPTPTAVSNALEEASRVARFDARDPVVKRLYIADLKPTKDLNVADSELIVRYRSNLPVPPIVVSEEGAVLDGHKRLASAWAAGHDRIYGVVVKSDESGMFMEWLRWNN